MPLAVTARPRTTWPREKEKKPDEDVERAVKPALMRMKKEMERRARAPSCLCVQRLSPAGQSFKLLEHCPRFFSTGKYSGATVAAAAERCRGAGRRGAREGAGGKSAGRGAARRQNCDWHCTKAGWGGGGEGRGKSAGEGRSAKTELATGSATRPRLACLHSRAGAKIRSLAPALAPRHGGSSSALP